MSVSDRCPICDGAAKPRAENPHFPFCTARCKTVDLGKWMNEEYRVPTADDELEDEAENGGAEGASKTNRDVRH